MPNKKIVYLISNIDKALAFEWIATNLDKNRFTLVFILLNPSNNTALHNFLLRNKVQVYFLEYYGKKDIPKTFFKIYTILRKEKPELIHTHLFDASLIGLAAGKLAGISKRIFTRHHGDQHHAYYPKAVRYDKWINAMATNIIAPSVSVKNILISSEQVNPNKIEVVHHGFDLTYFNQVNEKNKKIKTEV